MHHVTFYNFTRKEKALLLAGLEALHQDFGHLDPGTMSEEELAETRSEKEEIVDLYKSLKARKPLSKKVSKEIEETRKMLEELK